MSQREAVVRKGLGEREPSIKSAAASLIVIWMHSLQSKIRGDHPTRSKAEEEVVSILRLFDLTQDVAVDALLSIFMTEVDIFNNIEFNGGFFVWIL